jgi:prepilin-type processing-associated H-X9-DG protein
MQTAKTLICSFQVIDDHGGINCLYCDGSVGLCSFDNCPRKIWQMRRILKQAANGLKLNLSGFMAIMPILEGFNFVQFKASR